MSTNCLDKKRVLVTGGLGFIGSNLSIRLVKLGADVTIIDSLVSEYGGNLFNIKDIEGNVKVNIADVRDKHSIDYLVRDKDYIFNLAGQVSHIDSMIDPYTDLEINTRSQISLLEACRKHNQNVKVIYTSTRQVYGKPEYLPVDEKHPINPTDVNGINTMAGEWYHTLYNRVYGIKSIVLRLTNTYGPRQLMKHNKQGFMAWFIRNIVEGKQIEIFGDGSQQRDSDFVDNVVDAIITSACSDKAYGNIYNIGGSKFLSLKELVEKMIEIAGRGSYKIIPFPKEKANIDIGSYYANSSKIKKDVGWSPKISIEEGLRRTFEYYEKYKKKYW